MINQKGRRTKATLETVPGHALKVALGGLPVTVIFVVVVSGLLVYRGVNVYTGFGVPTVFDPLYYVASLLIHSGESHFLGSMYFFVPAGVVMTYLIGNRGVLEVILVAHIPVAFVAAVVGTPVIGVTASAYALVAAVLVHAAWLATEKSYEATRVVFTLSVFLLAALSLVTVAADSAYISPVLGFLIGGMFESVRVFWRYVSKEYERRLAVVEELRMPKFDSTWEGSDDGEEDEQHATEVDTEPTAGRGW